LHRIPQVHRLVPNFGVEPYLIAARPNGNDVDWTRRFFKKWADYARAPLHGWAAHYYCGTTGHATKFDQNQWYDMLFRADAIGKLIGDQWQAMAEFDPQHKTKLIIDEWGCWHPAGTDTTPVGSETSSDCAPGVCVNQIGRISSRRVVPSSLDRARFELPKARGARGFAASHLAASG
jgi:hypothetical protein